MHRYVISTQNELWEQRRRQFFSEMKRIWRDDVEIFFWVDSKTYVRTVPLPEGAYVNNIWCKLAHIAILKDAVDKGYDMIAVMEDDLICCKHFKANFSHLIEKTPEDRDMLRFSWYFRPMQVMKPVPGHIYRCEDVGPWGTELYVIRGQEAIKKVYEFVRDYDINTPTDQVIWKAPVKSYMTAYSLWMQRDHYVN